MGRRGGGRGAGAGAGGGGLGGCALLAAALVASTLVIQGAGGTYYSSTSRLPMRLVCGSLVVFSFLWVVLSGSRVLGRSCSSQLI